MGFELEIFHPLMERRLTRLGMKYIHHFNLPNGKIIDFLAWRVFNGKTQYAQIYECKSCPSEGIKAIPQVLDYYNYFIANLDHPALQFHKEPWAWEPEIQPVIVIPCIEDNSPAIDAFGWACHGSHVQPNVIDLYTEIKTIRVVRETIYALTPTLRSGPP